MPGKAESETKYLTSRMSASKKPLAIACQALLARVGLARLWTLDGPTPRSRHAARGGRWGAVPTRTRAPPCRVGVLGRLGNWASRRRPRATRWRSVERAAQAGCATVTT